MKDGFDVLQFAEYIRARWQIVAICCAVGTGLALTVSLVLPKRYTATASILIGPPAGLDPRATTGVSPVYLESLRTYEHLASSDSLFLKALERLDLRRQYSARSIESLKRSVLKVAKPLNTRVIEISATLEDPVKAQALAQYVAEQTVTLSRSLDSQTSSDVAKDAASNFETAELRLKKAETAAEQISKTQAPSGLEGDLQGSRDLKFQVERDLAVARADLADLAAQPSTVREQVDAARARIANLESQDLALVRTVAAKDNELQRLTQQHETLDAELVSARKEYEVAKAKLADIRASASFRGERLDVFDTGIVPQRPSSPNVALNILIALFVALSASLVYLAFRYGYERSLQS